MKKTRLLSAIALASAASQVNAAGFQLVEHSVSGLGRAYAGEAAQTDNAGVIIRNPAAMAAFEQAEISIAGHYIMPDIDAEGTNSNVAGTSVKAVAKDVAPDAFIPAFAYVQPLSDKLHVGLSMTSHFGMSTDYGDWAGSEHANFAEIHTYYITPSVSYKLQDNFSLGLGVSYIYAEGHLKYSLSDTGTESAQLAGLSNAQTGDNTLELKGDDSNSWSFNLSAFWEINENHQVGFRYQSATDIEFDGDVKIISLAPNPEQTKGYLPVELPEMAEIGYVFKANEKLTLSAGAQFTGWSSFKELNAYISSQRWDVTQPDIFVPGSETTKKTLRTYNWEDAMRYSLGADYQLNDSVILRAGLAYDEKAAVDKDHASISLPDTDRIWYSAGATFILDEATSIDAGITYIDGEEVKLSDVSSVGTTFEGTINSSAPIIAVAYNQRF